MLSLWHVAVRRRLYSLSQTQYMNKSVMLFIWWDTRAVSYIREKLSVPQREKKNKISIKLAFCLCCPFKFGNGLWKNTEGQHLLRIPLYFHQLSQNSLRNLLWVYVQPQFVIKVSSYRPSHCAGYNLRTTICHLASSHVLTALSKTLRVKRNVHLS